jgi:hypothetical protein
MRLRTGGLTELSASNAFIMFLRRTPQAEFRTCFAEFDQPSIGCLREANNKSGAPANGLHWAVLGRMAAFPTIPGLNRVISEPKEKALIA